jgi:hypothetical protein
MAVTLLKEKDMLLSPEIADKVWTILVEECEASKREEEREVFVFLMGRNNIAEYRFCGSLGFGGKFWSDRFKVSCYIEDETEEKRLAMERANARLAILKEGI